MQGHAEFVQELQVLGGCRHEHILPLLGFCASKGMIKGQDGVSLVLPLMAGGSLQDRLFLDEAARQRLLMIPGAPEEGVCVCVCVIVS